MEKKLNPTALGTLRVAVAASVLFAAGAAFGQVRTYTLDADFDEGILDGVEHDTVPDQLQLSRQTTTLPVMWIANAGEDTLSKWDTDLNCEVGRYPTWFGNPANHGAYSGPAPSRTAVDLQGNAYVVNRHFDGRPASLMKVLNTTFIDRNNNGIEETSIDVDNSCTISVGEMLLMTDSNANFIVEQNEIRDERIAWHVPVGPNNGLGRCLAIDRDGDLYVGLYNTRQFWKVSGIDGAILGGPFPTTSTPYGALVDRNGVLWAATLTSQLIEFDTVTDTQIAVHNLPRTTYGIAIGRANAGHTLVYPGNSSPYGVFDSSTDTITYPAASYATLGVSTDPDGNLVGGNPPRKWVPTTGAIIWTGAPNQGGDNRGCIVDARGDVWTVHLNGGMAKWRGTDGGALGTFPTGLNPYTYSDATGLGLRTTFPRGTWTVNYDSGCADTNWDSIDWTELVPPDTTITVRCRSSNDLITFSAWEDATNGGNLAAIPDARYIQVQVTFQLFSGDDSPVLYDLTINGSSDEVEIDIYPNRSPNPIYLDRKYTVYVAVLGSETFDVSNINNATVRFGRTGTEAAAVRAPIIRDLNGDGRDDAMYGFLTHLCGFIPGDTSGTLSFSSVTACNYSASDAVVVIAPGPTPGPK